MCIQGSTRFLVSRAANVVYEAIGSQGFGSGDLEFECLGVAWSLSVWGKGGSQYFSILEIVLNLQGTKICEGHKTTHVHKLSTKNMLGQGSQI